MERTKEIPRDVFEKLEKVVECPTEVTIIKPVELEKHVLIEKIEPKIFEQEKLVYTENPLIIPQETKYPFQVPILVHESKCVEIIK